MIVKNVKIKKLNNLFGDPYKIQAYFKVGKLKVDTKANCICSEPEDTVVPPPIEKEWFIVGWWKKIVGKIKDFFKGFSKIEDITVDKDDFEEAEEDNVTGEIGELDIDFGKDENTMIGDDPDEITSEEEKIKKPEPQVCGSDIKINGRNGVSTFKTEITDNGIFSCNNSCSPNQLCQSVANQDIVSGECTYCKNVCKEGQFRFENDCNDAKSDSQKCIISGYRVGGICYLIDGQSEPKKDEIKDISKIIIKPKCEIPNNQYWYNDLSPLFKHTILNKKQVLVENAYAYCGISSLEEFQKVAKLTTKGMNSSCENGRWGDFKYTNRKEVCSFIIYFE